MTRTQTIAVLLWCTMTTIAVGVVLNLPSRPSHRWACWACGQDVRPALIRAIERWAP